VLTLKEYFPTILKSQYKRKSLLKHDSQYPKTLQTRRYWGRPEGAGDNHHLDE